MGAQLGQQLQAAPAPAPFFAIGRIGQGLQLIDHALGHDHLPFKQTRIEQTPDSAVNNHAGVENFGTGGLEHPLGDQQRFGAVGIKKAQQGATVDLGEVVARDPEEHIADHGRQRFDEHHLPRQRQQQDRRQQQIGHQQAQDEAYGTADQQVGGHAAHLLHQLAAQLLEKDAGDDAEKSPEASQNGSKPLRVIDLQQQPLGKQINAEPTRRRTGNHKQDQDESVHHGPVVVSCRSTSGSLPDFRPFGLPR